MALVVQPANRLETALPGACRVHRFG